MYIKEETLKTIDNGITYEVYPETKTHLVKDQSGNSLSDTLNKIDSNIQGINTEVSEVKSDLLNTKQTVSEHGTNITSISGNVSELSLELDSVSSRVSVNESDIVNIKLENADTLSKVLENTAAIAQLPTEFKEQDALTLEEAKNYTDTEISKINNLNFEIVQELPLEGKKNIIYLLPEESSANNLYIEYIWLNNRWEIWGSASVDLTKYATKEDLSGHIHDDRYYQKPEVDTFVEPITTEYIDNLFDSLDSEITPANFYTKEETDEKLESLKSTVDANVLELENKISTVDNKTVELNTKLDNNVSEFNSKLEQQITDITNIQTDLNVTENSKYTTVNGVKEFECGNGYIDNVIIEGKTLVNIHSFVERRERGDQNVCFTIYSNNLGSFLDFTVFNYNNKPITVYFQTPTGAINYSIPSSSYKHITFPQGASYYIGTDYLSTDGWVSQDNVGKGNILILEGNYTDKSIPYFEGLKSIGQGDKIEVLTRVLDSEIISKSNLTLNNTISDNRWLNEDSTDANYSTGMTFNINIEDGYYCFDKKDLGSISDVQFINDSFTYLITPSSGVKFLPKGNYSIRYKCAKGEVKLNNISIYKVDKYDKKQILTTLRSLPNGVKDEIVKQGNKYYKIKRCEEIVLNGNENTILLERTGTNTLGFVIKDVLTNHKNTWNSIINDKLNVVTVYGNDIEGIQSNNSNPTWVHIGIAKTKLTTTQDVAGFKTYLSTNPITIVYELATPVIEEIPNFNPRTFSDKTTILLNSGVVQCEASFEVTNSMRSELEVLKGKATNIEEGILNNIYSYQKHRLTLDDGDCVDISKKDLNDIKSTGHYKGSNITNAPTSGWNIISVVQASSGALQYCLTSYTKELRFRLYDTTISSWTTWQKVATTSTLSLLEQQISELEIQAMENEV